MNQNTSHIRWPKAKDLVFHASEHTHTHTSSQLKCCDESEKFQVKHTATEIR